MQQPKTSYARNGDVSIAYQVVGEGPIERRARQAREESRRATAPHR